VDNYSGRLPGSIEDVSSRFHLTKEIDMTGFNADFHNELVEQLAFDEQSDFCREDQFDVHPLIVKHMERLAQDRIHIPKSIDLTDGVIDFMLNALGDDAQSIEGVLGEALSLAQSYLSIGFMLGFEASGANDGRLPGED